MKKKTGNEKEFCWESNWLHSWMNLAKWITNNVIILMLTLTCLYGWAEVTLKLNRWLHLNLTPSVSCDGLYVLKTNSYLTIIMSLMVIPWPIFLITYLTMLKWSLYGGQHLTTNWIITLKITNCVHSRMWTYEQH